MPVAQPRLVVLRPVLRGPRVRRVVPGPGHRPGRLDPAVAGRGRRRRTSPRSRASRCMLDHDALARGHDFYSVGGVSVSPDGTLLAYSTDTVGNERYVLQVKDLTHRRAAPRPYRGRARRRRLEPRRPRPLLLHRRRRRGAATRSGGTGSARSRPTTSWSSTRPTSGSGSGSDAAAPTGSWSSRPAPRTPPRCRFLDTADPDGRLGRLPPARGGSRVRPRARRDRRRGRLPRAAQPRRRRLRDRTRADRAPPRPTAGGPSSRTTSGSGSRTSSAYAGHLVVHQRSGGLTQLRIIELGHEPAPDRRLPGRVPPGALHGRRQRRRRSSTSPTVRVGLHLADRAVVGLRLRRAHPRADACSSSSRSAATTPRRTRSTGCGPPPTTARRSRSRWSAASVPRPRTDPIPFLLYGYGAYEISIDPRLLGRPALAARPRRRHGDRARARRRRDGPPLVRRRQAAAQAPHLLRLRRLRPAPGREGWTTHDRLVAEGGSAGGLLIGAVANEYPDLFGGLVADVPFVDALTSMLDASLPLTVTEYDEWGNPRRPGDLRLPRRLRAVRERRGASTTRRSWRPPRSTTPGCSTSSPRSGWPASAPRPRRRAAATSC